MKLGRAACWSPSHSDENNSWLGSSHPCRVQSLCQCLDCKAVPSHTITLPWLKVVCRINVFHLFGKKAGNVYRRNQFWKLSRDLSQSPNEQRKQRRKQLSGLFHERKTVQSSTHTHIHTYTHIHIHKKPSWRVHLAWLCYRFILIWGNVRVRRRERMCVTQGTEEKDCFNRLVKCASF